MVTEERIRVPCEPEPIFDDSPPLQSSDGIRLNAGLTDIQIADALFWHQFRQGVMLVSGDPGEGKGVLTNMMGWKFKKYFPGCKAILDYLPRRPFGHYHYFDQNFIVRQVDRMALLAKGQVSKDYLIPKDQVQSFKVQAKEWVSSDGQVYFKNSIVLLDEYRKRHNKRRPHDPLGILLTDVYNIRRHLSTLVVGITVKPLELDDKTCLPHIKFHTKLRKDSMNPDVFIASMHKVKWDVSLERLIMVGKPYRFPIYATTERPEMGEKEEGYEHMTYNPESPYYCWYDLFNTENAIALNVPKSMRREQ